MARPKTGAPPKRCLNLTVDEKTRERLSAISQHYTKSISALVAEWAEEKEKLMTLEVKIEARRKKKINSATDINIGGKLEKCLSCKHLASTEITRCQTCNEKNGYKYWEGEKEDG